nr:glycosyltransferase family 4 protein [uncultured Halomonas sp.]
MRILHFISSPAAGGAEIYVRDLAIRMSELGHKIFIIFLSDAQTINRDVIFEKKYLKDLEESNIGYAFLGDRSKKDLILGFFRIKKILTDFKPDVVHAHLHYALFYLGVYNYKLIYTHHSIRPGVPLFLYKIYNIKVATYVAISDNCQQALEKFSNKSVKRIDNAVNIKRLKPKNIEEIKINTPLRFLAIGRFAPFKNYEMLVEVVKELKNSNKEFKVFVAGEGSFKYKEKIINLIRVNELGDYIELLGQSNDMPGLLNKVDVFVMTSEYEGLPIALLEATLSGLPAIVTNVGSCGEVVEKCKSGYVVEKNDVKSFAMKMDFLIKNEKQRFEFAVNALENSSYYELNRSVAQHLEVYEEVI